jgi:two-component system nitrate/nitrite response regulator NarP
MLDERKTQEAALSVMIAHPDALIREAIAMALRGTADFVVDAAGHTCDVEDRITQGGPIDVVLLASQMGDGSAISTVRHMAQVNRGGAVIVLNGDGDSVMIPRLLEAGARGVIQTTMSFRSVPNAIRLVHSGEIFAPVDVNRQRAALQQPQRTGPTDAGGRLADQDVAILRRISKGMKNKEIAWELNLKEVSVKLHVRNMCRDLGAKNRTHAVVLARQMGLI